MDSVPIPSLPFNRFEPIMGLRGAARLRTQIADARALLDGRIVWNINSTSKGGGVAEMLQTLLGYERGAGLDARWLVIEGDPHFFALTKRIHHRLHGKNGDGGALSEPERRHYAAISRKNAERLQSLVRPRDVVILHDPQTAGLAPALRDAGALVVWRCHIGSDRVNTPLREAWEFLRPHLEHAHGCVFSRRGYVPTWLEFPSVFIIPPAIDAFSVKNQPMSRATARGILCHIGLLDGPSSNGQHLSFTRLDGTRARVVRKAEIAQTGPIPDWNVPTVVQVSRWDPLKDMGGVMRGFADRIEHLGDAHLVLVGPDVRGVTDDPEGTRVLHACLARWRRLPPSIRDRVHLVCLPMEDVEENAIMVNAIQRHAAVVTQKSLHEGFGLTVTEAMWKGRAIVASAVGGIRDQIVDRTHGLLLHNPRDTAAFGEALAILLRDRRLARRLGRNARRRAAARFLGPRQLIQFVELLYKLEKRNRPQRSGGIGGMDGRNARR